MQDSKSNTVKLKALCNQWGGSLFGVADLPSIQREAILLSSPLIDRLTFGISVGFHLSDAVLEGIEDRPTPIYFHHYQRINILLDTMALVVTSTIQEMGYQAMPIAASQIADWRTQKGYLSHKHLARAAGLGWIGRNNLLVNGRYGARIRLVSILTDVPLIIDAPAPQDCGSCQDCLSVCPARAIKQRPQDFDHLRCYEQLRTFAKALHLSHNICGVCVKACRGKRE